MTDTLVQPGLNSLSKSFEPAALEAHWGPEWEKRGYGVAGARGTGQPSVEAAARGDNFSIQLPPPNVTGTLHMGHAFNQTIMDSLTRYHRMRGSTPPGFRAPTMPALPRKSWWSASCRRKASAATTWARHRPRPARTLCQKSGSGKRRAATPSPPRCAAWATAWTGAASTSPWTPSCPKP